MLLTLLLSLTALYAAPKEKAPPKEKVLNDTWYIMQAGSAPWGYFHEIIKETDSQYSYKYELAKKDGVATYQEVIGAIANKDLTPIAFNLVKSGAGATEMIDATYKKESFGGTFTLSIKGRRNQTLRRNVGKDIILDVFFPVWIMKHWEKMKPKYRGWLMTFAEDQDTNEFRPRKVQFEVLNHDPEKNCLHIHAEEENQKSDWCLNEHAQLIELKIGSALVRKAKSEDEAKSVLKSK